jgi:hypothetical protein
MWDDQEPDKGELRVRLRIVQQRPALLLPHAVLFCQNSDMHLTDRTAPCDRRQRRRQLQHLSLEFDALRFLKSISPLSPTHRSIPIA